MHVLAVQSADYEALIASAGDAVLAGCRCSGCEESELALTESRVSRKVHGLAAVAILRIAIARCQRCRKRERVLPCDVLPGKITSAPVVFAAVAARIAGVRLREVARTYGVCILTIRLWVAGVGARFLDLPDLLRHRAMIASGQEPETARLVRLSAFVMEVTRRCSVEEPRVQTDVRALSAAELATAARVLIKLLDQLGGVRAAVTVGADVFRQAVLLFRTTPAASTDTSNYKARGLGSNQGRACQAPDDVPPYPTQAQPEGRCALALRADRAGARRSLTRAASTARAATCPRAGGLAVRRHATHVGRDALSLDPRLQAFRARGPPARRP